MAGFTFVVDDTSWDAANTAFTINDNTTRFLLASDFPLPEPDVTYAQPVDADGDIPGRMRYRDRQGCSITFAIQGTSASNLETTLGQWSQKLAKLNAQGGTLKATTPNSTSYFLQIRPGTHGVKFDQRYGRVNRAEVTWSFPAGPFWIGTAVQQTDTVETTLPYVSKTATGPAGDVPALGRLLIDEDQNVDQWWVVWGIEDNSLYDVTAASAALFYEAEGRTAMGGSATAVGPSGASGGGSNVMRNTALATSYQAILSTQATAAGAHLSHVGTFRVYARLQIPTTNTGTVSVALEWAVGDFRRPTQNSTAQLSDRWEGTWRLVDLGLVTVPKVLSGTQRWEGRVLAKSTIAGDDIDLDYLLLIPTSAGFGTASATLQVASPTSFLARDEFDQTTGVLAGKTLPSSGTWSGAGDLDDFSVVSGAIAQRTAVSDSTDGRFERAATGTATAVAVQVDVRASTSGTSQGVFARYTDMNNWVRASVVLGANTYDVSVTKKVAGTSTSLRVAQGGGQIGLGWYSIRLQIDAAGRWSAWLAPTGFPLVLMSQGQDADLATGGTLATGGYGMYDENIGVASTRDYDNFFAFAPAADAAMFALQSLEVRNDGVIRKDSAGAIWSPVSDAAGDLLRVPAAGRENRSVRWIVKACRNDPATGPDGAIDDISARLTQYPLYLTVPSP